MSLTKIGKSDAWYMDLRIGGKRKRISTATTNKKLATKLHDEYVFKLKAEQLGIAAPKDPTFKEFFQTYLDRKSHKLTCENDRLSGTKHILPIFGHMKLSQIRPDDIENFKAGMAKKGSTTTANRMLALLRHCLNLAVEWEMLYKSPFKTKLFKEHGRERVLSREEEGTLLANCSGRLRTFVKLAFATGARAGELKKLLWTDLDFDNNSIRFTRTKNGSTRTIAMSSAAREVLLDAAFSRGELANPTVIGLTTVSKAFRLACKKAGLETKGPNKVTPHTIRHTVATRLSWEGVDLPTIGAVLGHSQPSTIFKYAHPGSQAEALEKIINKQGEGSK